ncbi:hypothetical protein ACHAWU_003303 [Discostella pseudostelligera]|uniref:AAA+ ATPase domain-containing protein n=1 Tax=Discostella pseudostelligera TaxID=259834 RepID=A0ABD3MY75_9STRA
MSDTTLHELCKGFGALLSRSKTPQFPEEAARVNDRGNLPLHAACSFQATQDVVEALLKAYPQGASQPNGVGNLPLHQAAMWQASAETVEVLLLHHPEGATCRNKYGSLPLHMAASNRASVDVVRLLIEAYPDALHLQNDDGMTPLDLALAAANSGVVEGGMGKDMVGSSSPDAIIALLEGRPPPPELSRRQQAEQYMERADALERQLNSLRGSGGRHGRDLKDAVAAVRRLADCYPQALYSAGIDPNELEIALSNAMAHGHDHGASQRRGGAPGDAARKQQIAVENAILEAVKNRKKNKNNSALRPSEDDEEDREDALMGVRDRVEDLISSIVGLEHIKCQIRGLRRTTEICDLRESLLPNHGNGIRGLSATMLGVTLSDEAGRPRAPHMIFFGNPGTGKTAVARLLAKVYHELGILRKPKFLEVERMDLIGADQRSTVAKTREVLEEARGGILFVDEAYTLGMTSKRSRAENAGIDAMNEIMRSIDTDEAGRDSPLVILAGFPTEMNLFLARHDELRRRFDVTFEFPDYTCQELAEIFVDLVHAKGFYLEESMRVEYIAKLLGKQTDAHWRSERNGRVSEMLLAGARTEVRKRIRSAQFEEQEVDPQLILRVDIETAMMHDLK